LRLKRRVALVTGSSRGVGRAIALCFAKEGADIVVNYSSNERAAKETYEKVKATSKKAMLEKADVASKTEMDGMVNRVVERLGKIDILVNNAGIIIRDSLQTVKENDWIRTFNVNLQGPLYLTRAVSHSMIEKKYGKIINISSVGAMVVKAGTSIAYTASKAALIALTKKTAIELGPYGINVNAIAPGAIRTDMQYVNRSKEEAEKFMQESAQQVALRRIGEPEDIANAALFLASDESSFITGQVLIVDGGRMDFFSKP
jgi:3-oxoacyl-[acyl-carrier protein] reductase